MRSNKQYLAEVERLFLKDNYNHVTELETNFGAKNKLKHFAGFKVQKCHWQYPSFYPIESDFVKMGFSPIVDNEWLHQNDESDVLIPSLGSILPPPNQKKSGLSLVIASSKSPNLGFH